jgi:hypothetical protein
MRDVVDVVGRVEVFAVPAAKHRHQVSNPSTSSINIAAYMGKMTLDRIPPGHGVFGKLSVSRCGSKQGE